MPRTRRRFAAAHPGIEVEWQRRSLRDFGVQPIEDLAQQFDLLVIDHPFAGRAKALGCLLDLRPLFPADFHAMLEVQSVGPSTRCYDYGGLWGLPTRCGVPGGELPGGPASGLGLDARLRPSTRCSALGRKARKAGKWITVANLPDGFFCLVCDHFGSTSGTTMRADDDKMIEPAVFEATLGHLRQLVELSNPEGRDWNPIQTYDAMVARDDLV